MNSKILRARADLRAAMRGARKLAVSGRPFWVLDLFNSLRAVEFDPERFLTSDLKRAFSESVLQSRIRQILFEKDGEVCYALMKNKGRGDIVALPFASEMLEHLEEHGVAVDWPGSSRELSRLSRRRIWEAVKVGLVLTTQFGLSRYFGSQTTVFLNLNEKNTHRWREQSSHSFLGWFFREFEPELDPSDCEAINWGSVLTTLEGLRQCKFPYPPCGGVTRRLSFFARAFWKISGAVFYLLAGRATAGILLRDEIETIYVSLVPKEQQPARYIIDTGSIYRKPLWMELLEERGTNILMFHYSANIVSFDVKFPKWPQRFPATTWPNHVVFEEFQEKLLTTWFPRANFFRVRSIDYVDDDSPLPGGAGRLEIAIFDVHGIRPSAAVGMGFCPRSMYYEQRNWVLFFEKIGEISRRCPEVTFFVKAKRKPRLDLVSPRVIDRVDRIISEGQMVRVNEGVAARRLIEKCDAVISIPFSTPSFIAQDLGKPTVFFDPTGKVSPKSRGLVPVLGSVAELEAWVNGFLAS